MQGEQQRYDMLLQLIQIGAAAPAGAPLRPPGRPPAAGAGPDDPGRRRPTAAPPRPPTAEPRAGSVEGRVKVPLGASRSRSTSTSRACAGPAGAGQDPARSSSRASSSSPRWRWCRSAPRCRFPNFDPVAHNAFSNSPGQRLRSRAASTPGRRPVGGVQRRPGWWTSSATSTPERPTSWWCPAGTSRRFEPDGSFEIERGAGGGAQGDSGARPQAVEQNVEVGRTRGARVSFAGQTRGRAHLNKHGQALRVVQ